MVVTDDGILTLVNRFLWNAPFPMVVVSFVIIVNLS